MDRFSYSFSKQKCITIAGSSFLYVRIGCYFSSCMMLNEEIVSLGLMVGQKKQFADVTLGSG